MAAAMTEDVGTSSQRGLSEWWSEETEYVLQRIERWAAFARGYNRLRSQRLSKGRMTMNEEQVPRWSISENKLVIDDSSWAPRFHTMKRSHRRKSRPEETKINCCGTFDYQSNSNLDSSCLETYRYDHSIYFKTVGEIRNDKRSSTAADDPEDRVSISSEEMVEWEVGSIAESVKQFLAEEEAINNNRRESFEALSNENDAASESEQSAWPVVGLAKLELDSNDQVDTDNRRHYFDPGFDGKRETNNNIEIRPTECTEIPSRSNETPNQEEINRFVSFRRAKRQPKSVKTIPIVGNNNVIWPSVLLNYTKNIDPANSPHHRCAQGVK